MFVKECFSHQLVLFENSKKSETKLKINVNISLFLEVISSKLSLTASTLPRLSLEFQSPAQLYRL